ncbi:MBL fold metallo-hydrolase [Clostridium estertheticum]|uniref:MBL fold metallo-hydrolase n=1 Tax=Clostridium estertheticum TaxID=238834 RepID=UPI001CF34ECA|nr:MBL fold metallo-hydrolase [Clostridium estertheticum]MCB2341495.1 MBL fold metallo-hydrolase [Clostridium estertheticum]
MEIIQLKLSLTNCFLIRTDNKYVLIDTGYEYDWDLFCKRLKSVGVRLSDISHIILTHHHDDHCGLLNKLLKENNNIQIIMSYLAKDLLLKGENENDILVEEEIRIKDIGINLNGKILKTPGHTIDSISVLFDDGDCIVGDAAANMLQFAGTKYCVIFICNIDEYYESWRKIICGNSQRVFPAHGKPFSVEKLKINIGKNQKKNMVMN